MKREIKFRIWNGEKMIYKSDHREYDDYFWLELDGTFHGHTRTGDEWFNEFYDEFNKINYELMQFTGLKDKNGKEIYEGDIILLPETNQKGIIEWYEKESRFCVKGNDKKGNEKRGELIKSFMQDLTIVVGNIYENPDLINS